MKLIDMKFPEKSKKELENDGIPERVDEEQYPYGLRLNFNKEEVDKLKLLQTVQAGAVVEIQAQAKVTSVRTDDTEKGQRRHNVVIQIQKIGLTSKQFEENEKEAAFKEGAK